MKTLVCAIALFAFVLSCSAQADTTLKQITTETDTNSTKAATNEITQARFPGGTEGWNAFMQKDTVFPKMGLRRRIKGVVILTFTVCSDGTVCDIRATGHKILREAAVATLQKMPKWIPATKDGKNVSSPVRQTIFYNVSRR